MTIVPNDGVHCVLSCLESFLTDIGQGKSWQDLRHTFESAGLCSHKGAVWTIDAVRDGCELLGVRTRPIPFHFPFDACFRDGSLFIFSTVNPYHSVRFYEQPEPEKIGVMDPNHAQRISEFRWVDWQELDKMQPRLLRLRTA